MYVMFVETIINILIVLLFMGLYSHEYICIAVLQAVVSVRLCGHCAHKLFSYYAHCSPSDFIFYM